MKLSGTDILFFLIICILLWFTNKQHDHIIYLEDTVKIQDSAISQQLFLIECQKIFIKQTHQTTQDIDLFYEKFN
jgi:hypothetical protein